MPARLITTDDLETAQFATVANAWALQKGILQTTVRAIKASEALEEGDFVNIYDNGGITECRLAIAADPTLRANGFVLVDVANGGIAQVYLIGLNVKAPVTTSASQVYLSDAVGGKPSLDMPTTPGFFIQSLGVAIANVGIFFTTQPIVELS